MNTQIQRMHAAKAQADERRRIEYRKQAKAYREWLSKESQAFSRRIAIAREYTRDSDEFGKANRHWHELLMAMPAPPPDHADWSTT